MKNLLIILVPLWGFFACNHIESEAEKTTTVISANDDFVYQYSIMDALLAGVYDGNMTFENLKKHGDFGIGGFNRLDGELLMNEGIVYKIRFNGNIEQVSDNDSTGIAFVKDFTPDIQFIIQAKGLNYPMLKDSITQRIKENSIYAIRISGKLKTMNARSPHPSSKPYMPLADYLYSIKIGFGFRDMKIPRN
ncbi:acetolactate decarboxylase [Thermoflexibacter ruber]|uniref:Alpha-acetolactate decarboxylase n=1 Tax=Thermoflexibacter ruber TaxID=1003 RepID=A0A1I2GCW9_9BACT|nr:acetolactate decarboxylase [Thermoflexibacter ruber]SFF14840.1 alpha-acetolactate decarboxylase [Thermoflexibacter ruber]